MLDMHSFSMAVREWSITMRKRWCDVKSSLQSVLVGTKTVVFGDAKCRQDLSFVMYNLVMVLEERPTFCCSVRNSTPTAFVNL